MEQQPTSERPQQHRPVEAERKGLLYRCPGLCLHIVFALPIYWACDVGSSERHNCVHTYPLVALTPLSLSFSTCVGFSLRVCVSLCVSLCLVSHTLNVPHNLVVCLSFLVCVLSFSLSLLAMRPKLIIFERKAMVHFSEYLCGRWSYIACSTQVSSHCFEGCGTGPRDCSALASGISWPRFPFKPRSYLVIVLALMGESQEKPGQIPMLLQQLHINEEHHAWLEDQNFQAKDDVAQGCL